MRRKHSSHNTDPFVDALPAAARQHQGQELTVTSRSPAYKKARQGACPAMIKALRTLKQKEESQNSYDDELDCPRRHLFEVNANGPSSPKSHTTSTPQTPPASYKRSLKRLSLHVSRDSSSSNLLELLALRPEMLGSLNSLDLSVCGRCDLNVIVYYSILSLF
jgi:hypothetical protein